MSSMVKARFFLPHVFKIILNGIFSGVKLTKILPLLTAMYSILCTRRLQPPRDDCPVREQWFSSVTFGAINRFGIYWPSRVLSLDL